MTLPEPVFPPARPSSPATLVAALAASVVLAAVGVGWSNAASATDIRDPATTMSAYSPDDFVDEARALPAEMLTSVERDLTLSGSEYLAQAEASREGVDVVAALEGSGIEVLGSRMDGTELVVNIADDADRPAVAAAGATVEVGEPEAVDLSGIEFVPAFDVNGGDGYGWSSADGTSRQCSIGLTGHRVSDGRPVALTAGHCVAGMTSISGPVRQLVQGSPGRGGNLGQAIGSPGASRFGGGFDGGLVTLDGAGVTPRSNVLTWGGGAGAPRSTAALAVTDVGATIVGANLCKSGSRTGWTCGVVRAVDRSVNVGGSIVNSILATTCIQPGDSGGPALVGSTAVGVNSSTSSAACGTPDYVSAFFPMVSAAGAASVQSQFGAVWEPAVTLSAPTISAMTVRANGAPGLLQGSIPRPSTRSTVAVFVDGAATPALTVPASAGAWTVDLAELATSGVASGTHRLTVVSRLGSWSRSGGTDATIGLTRSPTRITEALIPAEFVER